MTVAPSTTSRLSPPSVRTAVVTKSARLPLVMYVLLPFTTKSSPSRRARSRSARFSVLSKELIGNLHQPRAQPLAEPLGLRVGPRGRRDTGTEQPAHHEVQRPQVGQLEPVHRQRRGLRQQGAQPVDG